MSAEILLVEDDKSLASMTLGDVIAQTANNYPDERFHPKIYKQTSHYTIAGIDPSPYQIWLNVDGVGTKPELPERLYEESIALGLPTPQVWEGLAHDTLAMVEEDAWRDGRYFLGAAQIVDVNMAKDSAVIGALARGLKSACDEGQFALLNGETAELGYRISGFGKVRLNWNAVGVSIFSPEKLLLGENLQPGQPVVVFRERSIRSNGLTKAREIIETAYLLNQGLKSKEEFVVRKLADHGVIFNSATSVNDILSDIFGHDALEQVLIPWHRMYPVITKQLLQYSRLYGPVMYQAQGKIDQPRNIQMVAAFHNTGGGIPTKTKRMVEAKGLGIVLDAVFPYPDGVTSLLNLVKTFPADVQEKIGMDDRTACEHWNGGVGFGVVTANIDEAKKLVDMAQAMNYEAAIAGEIIDKPEIRWQGHTWRYEPRQTGAT